MFNNTTAVSSERVTSVAASTSVSEADWCDGLTLRKGQQGDGRTQSTTTQADQVGALCLELQPLSSLNQVQWSALEKKKVLGSG